MKNSKQNSQAEQYAIKFRDELNSAVKSGVPLRYLSKNILEVKYHTNCKPIKAIFISDEAFVYLDLYNNPGLIFVDRDGKKASVKMSTENFNSVLEMIEIAYDFMREDEDKPILNIEQKHKVSRFRNEIIQSYVRDELYDYLPEYVNRIVRDPYGNVLQIIFTFEGSQICVNFLYGHSNYTKVLYSGSIEGIEPLYYGIIFYMLVVIADYKSKMYSKNGWLL